MKRIRNRTSTAYPLNLTLVGFALLSMSFYATAESQQEDVSELMDTLFSDDREVWVSAVKPLAKLEDKIVRPLAEAVKKEGSRYYYRAQKVYENLTTTAAKKELIALLDDQDERIVQISARALAKHGDSSAPAALTKAMKRIQDSYTRWNIANALWKVEANDQSAEAILNVARKHEGQSKYSLFEIVDNPIGRRHITEAERFDFLLNYKLSMHVGGPEALDIRLGMRDNEYDRELLPDNDDKLFLEKYRAQATDIMLLRLRDRGSTVAALLLGYFKEPKALPDLKKWFLESDSFYGWEGNWSPINGAHFTHHHCYEEAITHITGKPINEAIQLTAKQVAQLVQKYHQEEDEYDRGLELYVLFRLKPHIAREEAAKKFRNSTKQARFPICHAMVELLPNGFLQTEVRRLLGAPDKVEESSWSYDCGKSPIGNPYVLRITFENGKVIKIEEERIYTKDR
jgi:hypothetical protein